MIMSSVCNVVVELILAGEQVCVLHVYLTCVYACLLTAICCVICCSYSGNTVTLGILFTSKHIVKPLPHYHASVVWHVTLKYVEVLVGKQCRGHATVMTACLRT